MRALLILALLATPTYAAPPPPVPVTVVWKVLEEYRETGKRDIVPDEATRRQMVADRKTRVVALFEVCTTAAGAVRHVRRRKSSGYGTYDQQIASAMRTWTYKPELVHGKAVPACTVVTYIYSQQ
jgi:hypothetical protein